MVNKELVEKQAKEIIDKFAKALESVEEEANVDFHVERDKFERIEEVEGCETENGFKERILANAPKSDGDSIVAEKGSWKK